MENPVKFEVTVDRNPSPPKFSATSFEAEVSEYVTVGSQVMQVEATDPDRIQF